MNLSLGKRPFPPRFMVSSQYNNRKEDTEMETKRTELVFILDRSGSMSGLESDTIGGFNGLLEEQRQGDGAVTVTTVLFDHAYTLLHDRLDIRGVRPITRREYFARGTTALLDAMGATMEKIMAVQRSTAPELRAGKVLFVIITDGLENASRRYTYAQIQGMVRRQQEEGWEFLFLGANMDAIAAAGRFGIAPGRAANFHADSRGARLNYRAVSQAVTQCRAGRPLTAQWKAEIDQDFQTRKR